MCEAMLEPAVSARINPVVHAHDIQQVREAVQSGDSSAVFPQTVIRQVIRQDWDTMLRQGVSPRDVPRFMDLRELESLQDNPDLALTRQVLVHRLGLVRDSEFMATVGDAHGRIVWTGGNTKVRDEADRYGFRCGARWADMGTNGIRLVTQSRTRAAQIYGPEHWMDFQTRWTCTTVGIFDPHTRPRRLLAVINVTGPWTKVHSDTLGRLYEVAVRIEGALCTAEHRRQWGRLIEAAGPLERISGPALVIDRHGAVVAAYQASLQAGDRVMFPDAVGTAAGRTFLPALGQCVWEPLPARGWLVRPLRQDRDKAVIQVTLDLANPAQPWVRVTGANVSWHAKVRPVHARMLQRLAGRPDGITPAELQADLYGAGAKTRVAPEMSKLRKELGGLLHSTSHRLGDNRYRFGDDIIVDIHQ